MPWPRDVQANMMMDAPTAERFTTVLKGFVTWDLEETGARKGEITTVRKSVDRHAKRFIEICAPLRRPHCVTRCSPTRRWPDSRGRRSRW